MEIPDSALPLEVVQNQVHVSRLCRSNTGVGIQHINTFQPMDYEPLDYFQPSSSLPWNMPSCFLSALSLTNHCTGQDLPTQLTFPQCPGRLAYIHALAQVLPLWFKKNLYHPKVTSGLCPESRTRQRRPEVSEKLVAFSQLSKLS